MYGNNGVNNDHAKSKFLLHFYVSFHYVHCAPINYVVEKRNSKVVVQFLQLKVDIFLCFFRMQVDEMRIVTRDFITYT